MPVLPTVFMKPGQWVPNWKLIVMPLTTPSAKVSANTLTRVPAPQVHVVLGTAQIWKP
jgi:hypothetical protein